MESANRPQRFRCLLCPDTAVFDNQTSTNLHRDHPQQPLISDALLVAQFGMKADEPEHNEINVFNCPYCDRQRLSISTLYDHLTLEHLDVPFSVRCPVCVCFRGHVSIPNGIHLTKHLAEQHSSSLEHYQQHITVYKMYGDGECELLRFVASTLPPTYCENGVPKKQSAETKPSQRMCSICLELVGEHNCRELTCGHKFHAGCIDPWTAQNATCPVCRTAVT
ncbi:hypothetical protein pipiens_002585 [Culex pipiens pipiens]|uniref:RING-type domain-containing protein n=1 Tax=Culex pipiens pipiens TaxID=38569 RepID=A0ABD1DBT4_CULPP